MSASPTQHSAQARSSGHRRRYAAGFVGLATALLTVCGLTACGASSGHGTASESKGDRLPRPITLTASAGQTVFRTSSGTTTTLDALQEHKLMLLYFGYTHCPDVCPTTMADLGQALRQLPTATQRRVRVVFVTSDPDRDTASVMKTWLANFNPHLASPFVGLTSSLKQIDAVANSVGVPLEPPEKEPNGSIIVQHGPQTIAFIGGKADVLWLASTPVGDYAHDIKALADQVEAA